MGQGYTGLHGRSPFGTSDHVSRTAPHFAPEHWESLDRGICPACGRTVRWDYQRERWVIDPSLTVLVLTADELAAVQGAIDFAAEHDEPAYLAGQIIERMAELNRPLVEESGADA